MVFQAWLQSSSRGASPGWPSGPCTKCAGLGCRAAWLQDWSRGASPGWPSGPGTKCAGLGCRSGLVVHRLGGRQDPALSVQGRSSCAVLKFSSISLETGVLGRKFKELWLGTGSFQSLSRVVGFP